MPLGNVVNQLHDKHRFSDPCTSEQTDFSTLGIRSQQVNHFNTRQQQFLCRGQILKPGRITVDGKHVRIIQFTQAVNSIPCDIQQPAFDLLTDRHGQRPSQIPCFHTAVQTVRRIHCHTTHRIFPDMLFHFDYQFVPVITVYTQSRINGRQILAPVLENDVNYRSHHLCHISKSLSHILYFKYLLYFISIYYESISSISPLHTNILFNSMCKITKIISENCNFGAKKV